ncbi:MAG: ribosomal-processing cysteine protease Prp [Clostridia bacterium]|nr:ribosomal-processing cysteine protease Prp [Clostridia bacterium]
MIRFKFVRSGKSTVGFECSGHAGFAQAGQDIVCAAVSSAAYLTANTITDSFNIKADAQVDDGYMRFTLLEESDEAQKMLDGLEAHIRSLAQDYPRSIKVIYGGNTNA